MIVLSYSCISGTISDERETGTPGKSFFLLMIFFISFSLVSLANELINETVRASMPFLERALMSFSSLPFLTVLKISPDAEVLSSASIVNASGANGSLLL